jgi:SNF2 family DNA or RNA helicase
VTVYRLVVRSTVDQNIYNLSQRKLRLDAGELRDWGRWQFSRAGGLHLR